jgi:DHA1 family tetracycline resistance protein-like MFS transporter
MFTFVFAAAIRPGVRYHLPGAPFLLASGILLAALPLALLVTRSDTV